MKAYGTSSLEIFDDALLELFHKCANKHLVLSLLSASILDTFIPHFFQDIMVNWPPDDQLSNLADQLADWSPLNSHIFPS